MSLEKSKNVSFANFVYALGIANVGIKTAKDLAKNFENFEELEKTNVERLLKIKDIGEIVAQSIVDFFGDSENKQIINNLFEKGVTITYKKISAQNTKIAGKNFVLTGTLPTLSRNEATKLIEDAGGNVLSSVSKNIDFVLLGQEPGSKFEKAKQLGIKIIDEQEFLALLN